MKKPVLVVMAAGMGSRYGGLKQIDPIASSAGAFFRKEDEFTVAVLIL